MNQDFDNDQKIMAEINMTPLIDIMLVLLIIFMITSSVQLDSGLEIDLPTQVEQGDALNQALVVSLDKDQRIYLNNEWMSLKILEEELKILLGKSNNKEVILQGDRDSNLQRVVEIMEAATRAGARSFSLATELQN